MSVSIIMPYFESEIFLEKTIRSIKNQNYQKWELIIIDDENTKKSRKLLSKLKEKNKIKIYHNKKRIGAGLSRNKGIKKSKKKFIAFLDSDDLWKKDKLRYQIKEMNKRKLDFCFTGYECLNEKGKKLYKVKAEKSLNYNNLLSACNIACSSVMLKRKIFKKVLFNNFKTKEDYSLWIKISKLEYKIGGVNKILTSYLSRSSSLSSKHFNKIINAFMIYKKENNFSIFFSFYCVGRLYFNAFKKKFFK
tara:strand:- start:8104 stop:8847 length:744 start_codon:yes stop_codon:yes gene_type:complete